MTSPFKGALKVVLLHTYSKTGQFANKSADFCKQSRRATRAVGGFLVSARTAAGEIEWIEVHSEAGSHLQFYNPWSHGVKCIRGQEELTLNGSVITMDTVVGELIRLVRA